MIFVGVFSLRVFMILQFYEISVIVSEKTSVVLFSTGTHPAHIGGGEETI